MCPNADFNRKKSADRCPTGTPEQHVLVNKPEKSKVFQKRDVKYSFQLFPVELETAGRDQKN